jgi:hypothetical protein
MLGLERTLRADADIGGLLLGQLGEPHAELAEMQPRHLLVEVLGQHVDLVLVLVGLGPQLDLGQHLVGEARRHDEARMAGGVAEVQQPALRQQDHALAVGNSIMSTCGLMLTHLRFFSAGDLDLVVEVADVADDRHVLHLAHVVERDDVLVAGGGDEDVGGRHHVLQP